MDQPQMLYQNHSSESFLSSLSKIAWRVVARMIDYQIILITFVICDFLVEGLITSNIQWLLKHVVEIPSQPLTFVLLIMLFFGYFILFHSLNGQTLGKYICGIRVTSQKPLLLNDHPKSPNLVRNILREAGWILSILLGGWPLLLIILNQNRRGIHDWLGYSEVRGA
jgi:uncharacterized RDD family membrane protein YckC